MGVTVYSILFISQNCSGLAQYVLLDLGIRRFAIAMDDTRFLSGNLENKAA